MRHIILLLATLLLFSACSKKTKAPEDYMKKLNIQSWESFTYVSFKGKMKFKNDQQSVGANVNIRLCKDSLIWVSARAMLGIEGARMLIRRDSAFLLNRLNKTVYAYDYPKLAKKLNVKASFEIMQALLLGNLLPLAGDYDVPQEQEGSFLVAQKVLPFMLEHQVSRTNGKITSVSAEEIQQPENKMRVKYKEFKEVKEGLLPHDIRGKLEFKEGNKPLQTTEVEISFQEIEPQDEPLSFPFSIPSRYTRR